MAGPEMVMIPEGEVFEDKMWYIMIGVKSDEPISYGGILLIHDNPDEMRFLFNHGVKEVIRLPKGEAEGRILMSIKLHPQINGIIRFPLRRKDFKRS